MSYSSEGEKSEKVLVLTCLNMVELELHELCWLLDSLVSAGGMFIPICGLPWHLLLPVLPPVSKEWNDQDKS